MKNKWLLELQTGTLKDPCMQISLKFWCVWENHEDNTISLFCSLLTLGVFRKESSTKTNANITCTWCTSLLSDHNQHNSTISFRFWTLEDKHYLQWVLLKHPQHSSFWQFCLWFSLKKLRTWIKHGNIWRNIMRKRWGFIIQLWKPHGVTTQI